jgi:polyisoprenoid-binding protein YceI
MTTALADEIVGSYTIDPAHSRIGFVARHAMVTKVRGSFNEFEGTAKAPSTDPATWSAQVVIQAKSIDTRNEQRDEHLRSNDFLAMDDYPTITFSSTSIEPVGEPTYRVNGDLTVRGVTKPVSIDVEYQGAATDPFGNHRVGFEGSTTISRKDFGITWNAALETGGVLVGDKIVLEFEISAIKQN